MEKIFRRSIFLIAIALLFIINISNINAQMILSTNANMVLSSGANIKINGSLTLGSGAVLTQNGSGLIELIGDWINNGATFTYGTGTVAFTGSTNSTIKGTSGTSYYILTLNKDNNFIILYLDQDITVNNSFSFIQGVFSYLNDNANRTFTLLTNLSIPNGSIFDVQSTGTPRTHSLSLTGNITNNGTLDLNTGSGHVCNVTFTGSSNSTISGSGLLTNFNEITLNKSSQSVEVEVTSDNFTVPATGFLTLNGGTFHLSRALTNPIFTTGNWTIPSNSGLWLDNSGISVTAQNGSPTLSGLLKISSGTMNIGTSAGNNLSYNSGSVLTIENGTLNISNRIARTTSDDNATITYTQSGGQVNVSTVAASNANNRGNFDIGASGSTFNWSGGTIELQRRNNLTTVGDYYVNSSNGTVSGGILKINSSESADAIFRINTVKEVGEFLMTGTNNPIAQLYNNNLTVLGDLTIAGTGSGRLNANNLNISLRGNWNNNSGTNNTAFTAGTGTVTFYDSLTQKIQGTQSTTFNNVTLNKTVRNVELGVATRIDGNLRLLSARAIVDLTTYDLTIGPSGKIYSDAGTTEALSSFDSTKCVMNTGSGSDPLVGGRLIRMFPNTLTLPADILFPVATPARYTPGMITLLSGGATFGSNPQISVKPVPQEHPMVEVSNRSLTKYWVVDKSDLSINTRGVTVTFYYNALEAQGSEGNYVVLWYSPSYNDPSGYWRVDPGEDNDIVDFNLKLFYSQQASEISGDWTAGEPEVARATYYSRADGDYNNPSTWSKVYFGGTASTTAPNKRTDRVRIQHNTVTISGAITQANAVIVEDGTEGRQPGKLVISGNNYIAGDTFRLQQNTTISIGHDSGIVAVPTNNGAIRTTVRDLSSSAVYIFNGPNNQFSGNGLPSTIRSLITTKDANDTLKLSGHILISDSLVINSGALDLDAYSINGSTSGRIMRMRGGELIIRSTFPTNYTTPTFTAGKITFDGTGSQTIPSSGSTPGVNQYYKLKISGTARDGNITFQSSGEIKISDSLDISSLNFVNNTKRFFTNGSTVRFNGNGVTQNIPCKPASPSDSVVFLDYYNLILDSSGTKQLSATGTPTFRVLNDLTITNNASFVANNHNLEINNNWTNISGTFTPGTGTVIFRSPVALFTTTITSRSTTDNPFNNLRVDGDGIVAPADDIRIQGNFIIGAGSTFNLNTRTMTLFGNWTNLGGTFTPGTSTVLMSGTTTQTMTKTTGNESLYNFTINNTNNVNASGMGIAGNGIIVNNNLSLNAGNLITHSGTNYRFVTVLGTLTRTGGGYVDGELRKNIPTGTSTTVFEVGYNKSYTPITVELTGTGGTAGLLGVLSDTITTSTSPLSWDTDPPSDILPTGSQISPQRHVARQYTVSIPSGSSFVLSGTRKYNTTFTFIDGVSPNGDLRNGANASDFTVSQRSGSNWINQYYYGTTPYIGTRTSTTTQFVDIQDFGTFVVGEPGILSYYTRASGNWTTPSNWSTQQYGGTAATTYPGQTSNLFRAYIGDGDSIVLNTNIVVNAVAPNNGLIQVDSSGKLNCGTYIISGTGEFRLMANSLIGIGHSAGIYNVGTNNGNIQTSTRNYNYNSHNRGNFVYLGSANPQNTGNGLPTGTDSVSSLRIDKSVGTTLTVDASANLHVKDTLLINSGTFNLGTRNLYLYKYMRKAGNGVFQANSRDVYLYGTNEIKLKSDVYRDSISFYRLYIYKAFNTGIITLDTLTTVHIQNQLNFQTGNKAIIDASYYSSEITPLYVIFDPSATVSGAGHINLTNSGGWVYGEVRKNIPAGDAPLVTFETGTATHYTPYGIDFRAGSGSTAGYLSAKAVAGYHPKLYSSPQSLYPVNPNRVITVWWKLKKPIGSTFVRGNRNVDFRVDFVNPDLVTNTDCFGCADMTFYRGGDSLQWWQTMALNGTGENNNPTGGLCSDTRIAPHPTPNFDYDGDPCGSTAVLVYIRVNDVTTACTFGDDEVYSNGDTLLGDFVTGNRNSIKYYNFFSRQDGNWSDPNTWSTVSYSSSTNAAASDPDPLIRPVPSRQYDNVFIGNGKKVTLDMNVGHNNYGGGVNSYTFVGPSTFVEATGTLDFGTNVLRGNQFNAKKGSRVIIGSSDGIANVVSGANGNVQLGVYASAPKFNDSIDVVYTAKGRTLNRGSASLNVVNRNGTTHYIEEVTIRRASDNAIIMRYHSGNKFLVSSYCHIYVPASAELVAGTAYYLQINPSNVSPLVNRKVKAWIDFNYNYTFTDAGEQVMNVNSSDTTLISSSNFTVPAGTNQGSILMRVGIANNTTNYTPTTTGTGEFEEYTLNIVNPNETVYNKQVPGAGLPTILSSFTLHSPLGSATNPTFTINKNIDVLDSFKIISGTYNAGAYNINLYGDFIHDTLNGFNAQTSSVIFGSTGKDTIRGSQAITFNKLKINKTDNEKVFCENNITVNDTLLFSTNNVLKLNENKNITIGKNGTISDGAGGSLFSNNRMIELDGDVLVNNKVIKNFNPTFTTGSYCPASLSGTGTWITNVTIGTLNNTSGASGYSNFTALPAPVLNTGSNSITLTKNITTQRRWSVWIDFNRDGDFADAGETVINDANPPAGYTTIQNFTIPVTAFNGYTRMRVRVRNGALANSYCEVSGTAGEFEDYTINITGGTTPTTNNAFTFPVGTDTLYNPAYTKITATFTGSPYIATQLVASSHPAQLTPNQLKKYWRISSSGISGYVTDTFRFNYNLADIIGDTNKYIPGRYRIGEGWEIDLGTSPVSNSYSIRIFNDTTGIDGDWTAGEPRSYFDGRIFYSRNTGNWNERTNWSTNQTFKHNGRSAAYFPGQLYTDDTVNIDGHTITFRDSLNITIDSLRIGGTNSNPGQGVLSFDNSPTSKKLSLRMLFLDSLDNGLITGTATGTRNDTIAIRQNLINGTTGSLTLRNDNDSYTSLKFYGNTSSKILGSGVWGDLGNIILNKTDGLLDTLYVNSSSFITATSSATNFAYFPQSGVLQHSIGGNLYLSSGANTVDMEANTGFVVLGGSLNTRNNLTSNSNTTFYINGGNINIGDAANEHFLYKTGTTIDISNGTLTTAGTFSRALTNSTVTLNLGTNSNVMVLKYGNTDAGKIGFDLSNSGSSLSMSAGRIIIANGNGTTPSGYDYRVNAQGGTGITGGTIQAGDTTLTPNGTTIKIGGNLPVYNLHFANSASNAVQTQITEENFTIRNNWDIDENHTFNLSGNTVYLGGNLTNYGTFIATPGVASTQPWQIVLNGSSDQTLFTDEATGLRLYNLRIGKSTGNVLLASGGNSNLIIRNTLEFETGNNSFINAPIASGRYVELSPETGSNPQFLRNGLGHIYGRLYRYIESGAQNLVFPVGSDTIGSYRPVRFETSGTNTAGLLGVVSFNFDHPDIVDAGLVMTNYVPRYWKVEPATSGGFSLGTGNTYSITTQYLNPNDLGSGGNPLFYEHRLYHPPCPDPPTLCDGSGTWDTPNSLYKTDTSVKSTSLSTFGDFVIGEPFGITFYSIANGRWDDPNTWSNVDYYSATPASRYPNVNTDIVRIGNNKTVTLTEMPVPPTIRSVIIEKDPTNKLPGTLLIEGLYNYLRGTQFLLSDSCTLGVQHLNGIAPSIEGFRGAVQTTTRNFGLSRYIYFSNSGSQNTGMALPSYIKTLIVNNPSNINKTCYISNPGGAGEIIVQDTILIQQGILNAGNRNLGVQRVMIIDSVINDGRFEPTSSKLTFYNSLDKYLIINNHNGARFYQLNIDSGTVTAKRNVTRNSALQHVYVENQLEFQNPSYLILGDNVNLKIENSDVSSILNYGSDKHIRTSVTSGSLIRTVSAGNTYVFPIGSYETAVHYAPATFEAASSGTTGSIGVRTSPGVNTNQPDAHISISSNPSAEYIGRYWAIDSVTATINGKWTFQYLDYDIHGTETNLTKIGRWRPAKEITPGIWTHPFNPSVINYGSNTFETDANYSYTEFLGDWTLGNQQAFRRIFFSRQTGLWNDENSWTYSNTHSGPIYGAGIWPNLPQDSVVIGGGNNGVGNHEITLNVNNPLGDYAGIALGTASTNTGTLNTGTNILNGYYFTFGDYSTLKIGSPNGITTLGNASGNIQTTISREFNTTGNYYYNGSSNQSVGNGLPSTVNSLTIDNSGTPGDNTVSLLSNISITDDLSILNGRLDLHTYSANGLTGTGIFTLNANATIRLGGTLNLLTAINNYSTYNIDVDSYTEFYGTSPDDQVISNLPVNLTNGLGNTLLNNSGTKYVNAPLLIRGDLIIANSAILQNSAGVDALSVRKNVINSSTINNEGVIEIGNDP